ncbi:MAG: hypothetical protein AAB375_01730 [Patescibacteria group bacterium]
MFVPGSISVILEGASYTGMLRLWSEAQGYRLSDDVYSDIQLIVGIPEGEEDDVIEALLQCDWVAAACREGIS